MNTECRSIHVSVCASAACVCLCLCLCLGVCLKQIENEIKWVMFIIFYVSFNLVAVTVRISVF